MNAPDLHKLNLPALRNDTVIQRLEAATTALAEAKTIQQAKSIADVAEAAEIYAKRQGMAQDAIDFAHSVRIEALRLVGEMLRETPRSAGTRGQLKGRDSSGSTKSEPPETSTPTLEQLGLDKKTSSMAQKLASLPAKAFDEVKEGHKSIGQALNVATKARSTTPAPQPEPTIPLKQYQKLESKYQELVEELETVEALRNGDAAKEMNTLRESLRLANRRRDELMTEAKEKQKQIDYCRRELQKMGWKPKK